MSKILIVVPDITRKAHLKTVLPRLLRLEFIGARSDVKIIVATGLHKPHTKEELKNLVGGRIFSRYQVITHTQDKKDLVYKGRTKNGIPIVLNKNLEWADFIVTVGLVEPHLYAGYSGGIKVAAIGLAGEETISSTHHPSFLDKQETVIGSIRNNPFQDCLWEIVRALPIRYSVNIVNNPDGRLKKIFCGPDPRKAFYSAVRFANKIFEKRVNRAFDAVICRVSPPKDVNMYQASRAFNYVLNVRRPILKKGGLVLVCASLKDGFGKGLGEKRFAEALKKMHSPEKFITQIKNKGCIAGEHRTYMVAKAMTKAQLGFIGPQAAFYTKGLPLLSFPNLKSAIKFIKHAKGKNANIYTASHILSSVLSK